MAEQSLAEFAQDVKADPDLMKRLQADPVGTLEATAAAAYTKDRDFYRIAIAGLIGIILIVIVAAVILQLKNPARTLPDWTSALATTALGGLVGLFAPSPTGK
jgi:hypothetical protein